MTNEPRPLLELYKLLWEQINDNDNDFIFDELNKMHDNNIITIYEVCYMQHHIMKNRELEEYRCEKSFVQRIITELENEIK